MRYSEKNFKDALIVVEYFYQSKIIEMFYASKQFNYFKLFYFIKREESLPSDGLFSAVQSACEQGFLPGLRSRHRLNSDLKNKKISKTCLCRFQNLIDIFRILKG